MKKLSKPTKEDLYGVENKEVLEDMWDQQFSSTYKLKEISPSTLEYFNSINKRFKNGVMLDVGCGAGRNKKFFEDSGWVCYGTDITKEGLKIASKSTPINLVHALAHKLPFKDNMFDLVFCWRVLHNISYKVRKKSVFEMSRVLKQNGNLVICVQSLNDPSTLEKYMNNGIELSEDKNSWVVNQKIGDKIMPYVKHFYSKEDIQTEIEHDTDLKIVTIDEIEERSGLESVGRKVQRYWIVEAKKK